MWSLVGSIGGQVPVFAAISSQPPTLFRQLNAQILELKRSVEAEDFGNLFERRVELTLNLVQEMVDQGLIVLESSKPDSLRPLLLNQKTVGLGLRRLNAILRRMDEPISSIPVSSLDSLEGPDDDLRRRNSWFGRFQEHNKAAAEARAARIARAPDKEQALRQRFNTLATKLWNQQWPETQKETIQANGPVAPEQVVAINSCLVTPYDTALAVPGLAAELALAILDDTQHKHLLANVSAAMPVDDLRDRIRTDFPALTLTRIYVMTGSGLSWQSGVQALSAIHAAGIGTLESSIKLLRSARADRSPSLMLYGGDIYNTP